ncbi:MAG: hypothetical protein AAF567_20640 [Actinomycetota bacterium]
MKALAAVMIGLLAATLLTMVTDDSASAQDRRSRPKPYAYSCVNSSLVQGHADAATLKVGSVFDVGITRYRVIDGAQCSYNCSEGNDMNCDGKFGDYCPSGLNPRAASSVSACLASSAAPATPASADTGGTGGGDAGDALAFTGSETPVFAYLGFGMLAFGATALGVTRRSRNED